MKYDRLSVLLLDTKSSNPNFYIVLAIEQALRRSPRVSVVKRVDYATVVGLAQRERFDLLLAVDGEAANLMVLSKVVGLVGMAALWCWEDPYETGRMAEVANLFDAVFTNDIASVRRYSQPTVHLPLAATQRREVVVNDADYRFDIAFIGTAWPNRVRFLRRLLRSRPALRYRIALGFNEHLPNTYLDLPESTYTGNLSHLDFLDISNHSRINLVLHRAFSGDGLARSAETPGPRVFETALAGGFQLVDSEGMQLEELFTYGIEIAGFHGFDEAVAQIDLLLATSERRIDLASAAQKRAASEHTYDNRVSSIIEAVVAGRRPTSRTPIERKLKRRLLFVTHNHIAAGNFGGVEVYQETISEQMRAEYDIYFYRPDSSQVGQNSRIFLLTDSRHRTLKTISVSSFEPSETLWHAPSEGAFASVVTEWEIDLVHFHHLINHSQTLPFVCRALGIPSVYTFQDFWSVCSRFNLIDYNNQYCRPHERSRSHCDVCLASAEGRPVGSQALRRSFFAELLQAVDHIVFNSPASVEVCRRIYPELSDTSVSQLGLPLPWTTMHRSVSARKQVVGADRPALKVVFLGNFTSGKGADTFLRLAELTRDTNIAYTIAGRVDNKYGESLKALADRVTVAGEFAPGSLDLSEFDLSLHLSIWPETYCITLSEAWKAGVVPIVSDCGALADRVHAGVDGFKVPIDGVAELLDHLVRVEGNRRELDKVRAAISADLWMTPQQHCQTLDGLYRKLLADRPMSVSSNMAVGPTSTITDALRGSRRFPPKWSQLDWPVLPRLPDPSQASRNPLQPHLAAVRKALDDRTVGVAAVTICIDSFGSVEQPTFADGYAVSAWTPARPPVQLVGWLYSENVIDDITLMLRSSDGDIILRPVYLHERADLVPAESGELRVGFLTDPFAPEMLQDGLYELSFIVSRGSSLFMAPLAAGVASHGQQSALIQTKRTIPTREPFKLQAPADLVSIHAWTSRFRLDELSVRVVDRPGPGALAVLTLHGWSLCALGSDRSPQLYLELRGPESFNVPMTMVERPDVSSTVNLGGTARCGFEVDVWLKSLPLGRYELVAVQTEANVRFERDIGTLSVTADAAGAQVEVLPVETYETPGLVEELA